MIDYARARPQTDRRVSHRAWTGVSSGRDKPGRSPAQRKRRWGWLAVLMLAGLLVFCHGCHGDEDNELLASAAVPIQAGSPR